MLEKQQSVNYYHPKASNFLMIITYKERVKHHLRMD